MAHGCPETCAVGWPDRFQSVLAQSAARVVHASSAFGRALLPQGCHASRPGDHMAWGEGRPCKQHSRSDWESRLLTIQLSNSQPIFVEGVWRSSKPGIQAETRVLTHPTVHWSSLQLAWLDWRVLNGWSRCRRVQTTTFEHECRDLVASNHHHSRSDGLVL